MPRKVLLCLILLMLVAFSTSAAAVREFKDVPEDMWAAPYVYDLVKLGVTTGYPDGTFRGKNKITRYEAAVMMAKLADKLGGVDLIEVKEDIATLKQQIADLRRNPQGGAAFSAEIDSYSKAGNLLTASGQRGPVMDYRLKSSVSRDFGDGASVAVNLDTMDAGYGGGQQELATQLLDVEGKLSADVGMEAPIDFTVTVGPGARTHTVTTGALVAETGEIFVRPDSGVLAQSKMWGMDVEGGAFADSIANNGYFDSLKIIAGVGYSLGDWVPVVSGLDLGATATYLRSAGGSDTDRKIDLTASAIFSPKIITDFRLGIGGSDKSGLLVGADMALKDVFDTGTIINVSAVKIGAQHINPNFALDIAGLDYFNRAYVNSSVDLAGKIEQAVSEDLFIKGIGDIRLSSDFGYGAGKANSLLTMQGGLAYQIAPGTLVDAAYRIYQDPNATDPTTDMAVLGLTYKF